MARLAGWASRGRGAPRRRLAVDEPPPTRLDSRLARKRSIWRVCRFSPSGRVLPTVDSAAGTTDAGDAGEGDTANTTGAGDANEGETTCTTGAGEADDCKDQRKREFTKKRAMAYIYHVQNEKQTNE